MRMACFKGWLAVFVKTQTLVIFLFLLFVSPQTTALEKKCLLSNSTLLVFVKTQTLVIFLFLLFVSPQTTALEKKNASSAIAPYWCLWGHKHWWFFFFYCLCPHKQLH